MFLKSRTFSFKPYQKREFLSWTYKKSLENDHVRNFLDLMRCKYLKLHGFSGSKTPLYIIYKNTQRQKNNTKSDSIGMKVVPY